VRRSKRLRRQFRTEVVILIHRPYSPAVLSWRRRRRICRTRNVCRRNARIYDFC